MTIVSYQSMFKVERRKELFFAKNIYNESKHLGTLYCDEIVGTKPNGRRSSRHDQ